MWLLDPTWVSESVELQHVDSRLTDSNELTRSTRKIRGPDKFLIPCDFPGIDECLALADLGASINLMPLSVWNKLSFPELTPTWTTLELADRSISRPIGVAEDIERALIDVYAGELTLRVNNEAVTFNLDQTSRYSANYNDMTANRIDVIDMACEEYSQEVLGFSNVIVSGNPTPYYDPIISTSSPILTPFGNSDFLLEEVDAFLALKDDPTSREVNHSYYNTIERALIDVYAGQLTLRVNNEAVTFNLDQTSRYSANYNDMTANRIDVIDMACEEYSQEVLGFSNVIVSGNPTPYYNPIISTSSPILTPFGNSDFLLEEVDAFLALKDDPTSWEVDHSYYNTVGDILLLEAFLNDDPSLPPPNQGMYLP
nr:reverse transcriptase domain-containing protein [Tanacetum cinerariifolium]